MTGSLAFLGQTEADAMRLVEKNVNAKGGIHGRPIHFVIQDDQSNAVVALQLANTWISKNVPVILGPVNTSACNAITPLISKGPVVYCFTPTIHPPSGSYMFSSSIGPGDIITADIRFMRLRGWHKIGLIFTTDATGEDGARFVDDVVALPENKGVVSIVDREPFNLTDLSISAQISRVKASGAQAVFVYAVGTPFGTVLRGAYEGGLNIPIVSTAANFNVDQLNSYAGFIPDELYMGLAAYAAPSVLPAGGLKDEVNLFLDSLKASGLRPAQPMISSWDPAIVVVAALQALGTNATAAQIRTYIANLTGFPGIQGVYNFRKIPQRGVGGDWVFVCRWDKVQLSMIPVSKAGGGL